MKRLADGEDVRVVGVALDLVNGEVFFSVNGEWDVAFVNVPKNGQFFPAFSGVSAILEVNFGGAKFVYGPPDGSFRTLVDVS